MVSAGICAVLVALAMSRMFKGMILTGSGDRSGRSIGRLHSVLNDGMTLLKASQHSPEDPRIEKELRDVVCDLVSAFGYDPSGLTWRLLPYPGPDDEGRSG